MKHSPTIKANILISTENKQDAILIKRLLLNAGFDKISTSTDPSQATTDFFHHLPNVLVLAFNALGQSERYYLGLHRQANAIHEHFHRTIVLCKKDEIQRAYKLCVEGIFDDYSMFWPVSIDVHRLPMSVHLALRELATAAINTSKAAEIAAQTEQLATMGSMIEEQMRQGDLQIESIQPTLLIVDDDKFQHKIIGSVLKNKNFNLLFAASGIEALEILRKTRPNLIMMDFMMPEMNGVEVVQKIKTMSDFSETPILMMTGKSDKAIVMESLQAGAVGFIVKPIDRDLLLDRIKQTLVDG